MKKQIDYGFYNVYLVAGPNLSGFENLTGLEYKSKSLTHYRFLVT